MSGARLLIIGHHAVLQEGLRQGLMSTNKALLHTKFLIFGGSADGNQADHQVTTFQLCSEQLSAQSHYAKGPDGKGACGLAKSASKL